MIQEAVLSLRALPAPSEEDIGNLRAALLQVGRDHTFTDKVRLNALAAIPGSLDGLDPELFDLLSASVKPSEAVTARTAAASVLGKSKLTPDQLARLTDSIRSVGPLELSTLLAAFQNASDETLGLELIAAIRDAKGLLSLRADVLNQCLANFPRSVQQEGEKLLASLEMDPVKQKARLEKLLASLGEGGYSARPGGLQQHQDSLFLLPRHWLSGGASQAPTSRKSARSGPGAICWSPLSFPVPASCAGMSR